MRHAKFSQSVMGFTSGIVVHVTNDMLFYRVQGKVTVATPAKFADLRQVYILPSGVISTRSDAPYEAVSRTEVQELRSVFGRDWIDEHGAIYALRSSAGEGCVVISLSDGEISECGIIR